MKPDKKNNGISFADIVAASEPKTETITIGENEVTIREMSGRERFELSKKAEGDKFDVLLWVAFIGLIEPRPESLDELETIRVEWITDIANAVLKLSGLEPNAEAEAENESASVTDIGGS